LACIPFASDTGMFLTFCPMANECLCSVAQYDWSPVTYLPEALECVIVLSWGVILYCIN
jgi:hypothetical protein